ncbi:serine hydrolase domain-containing protein [Streptomyces sp. NPDC029004]|uniref:serine hydrolase domain-containing protein n=1 Tax=Streptomyces sp. NPDC029004 TaxID=3154490 RepID=UPI0033FF0F6D
MHFRAGPWRSPKWGPSCCSSSKRGRSLSTTPLAVAARSPGRRPDHAAHAGQLHHGARRDYVTDPGFLAALAAAPFRQWTPEEPVGISTALPRWYEPGTNWSYSHANFVLLGAALEKITGTRLGVLLKRRIMGPLGLRDTRNSFTPDIQPPVLHAFTDERGPVRGVHLLEPLVDHGPRRGRDHPYLRYGPLGPGHRLRRAAVPERLPGAAGSGHGRSGRTHGHLSCDRPPPEHRGHALRTRRSRPEPVVLRICRRPGLSPRRAAGHRGRDDQGREHPGRQHRRDDHERDRRGARAWPPRAVQRGASHTVQPPCRGKAGRGGVVTGAGVRRFRPDRAEVGRAAGVPQAAGSRGSSFGKVRDSWQSTASYVWRASW